MPATPITATFLKVFGHRGRCHFTIVDDRLLPMIPKAHPTSGPCNRVRITKPFYLGVYEVTQEQYERIMDKNPSSVYLGSTQGFKGPFHPVNNVSWYDAVEFCKKLSAQEGRIYRLPTEAQWEYACRAGTTTPFNFGSALNGKQANCLGKKEPYGTDMTGPYLARTTIVGSYAANAFGLYDMHGNIEEWCADWHDWHYYENSITDDPTGPTTGSDRILRGGDWVSRPKQCRSAYRNRITPSKSYQITGFRVVLVP
ncbi:MAG: formylglycine-generating enzyme family protein [Pirellulales bacterium]|nr:formylglycine-generating enzyme family protein [Pirellulales bacterium]